MCVFDEMCCSVDLNNLFNQISHIEMEEALFFLFIYFKTKIFKYIFIIV
jgi:hypothetical protein